MSSPDVGFVDLVSDSISSAPSSPSPLSSPPAFANNLLDYPTSTTPFPNVTNPGDIIQIHSMFEDDQDSPDRLNTGEAHGPGHASKKQEDYVIDLQEDASDDETDEEILKLVEERRKQKLEGKVEPKEELLVDHIVTAASAASTEQGPNDMLRGATARRPRGADDDVGIIGENPIQDVSEDMFAGDDGEYVRPSLEPAPLYDVEHIIDDPGEDSGAVAHSGKRVIELYNLNNSSSDATEEMPTPMEMNVVLLKHQRQALAWMAGREKDDKPVGTPRGGILADDQGFGKTLSMIALMVASRPTKKEGQLQEPAWGNLVVCPMSIMQQWAAELEGRMMREFKPRILIYHGQNRPRDPYMLVKYDVVITTYGMLRHEYPKVLARDEKKQPVQWRKKGPLYRLKWYRIVLDEAQAIKNHRSESFRAAVELSTDRRWSLTGTPIQNTVDDIYSQFVWLRYEITDSYKQWVRDYKKPLESRRLGPDSRAFKRFQVKLGVVLLRRAKHDKIDGHPVISLPNRNVRMAELQFTATERAYYEAQEKRAVEDMNRFGLELGFTTALVILLRLRQSCGHPALCDWGTERQFVFTDDELDIVDIRMQTRCLFRLLPENVQNRLAVELGPGTAVPQNCPICMDVIEEDGIVTKCGHIFCTTDFESWNRNNDTCPTCRSDVSGELDKMSLRGVRQEVHAIARAKERKKNPKAKKEKKVVKPEPTFTKFELKLVGEEESAPVQEPPTKRRRRGGASSSKEEDVAEPEGEEDNTGEDPDAIAEEARTSKTSTKITYFVSEYKNIFETSTDKVLCFSQWTRMLDLVQVRLDEEGFEYVRLDGKMNPADRAQAVQLFNTRSRCRLFLISLQAGSTGLNLTVANRVFLLDSWWNPAVEDQAIDRVHRIGQTKDVDVVRVKITNSVEDRILELQERKRAIIQGALGVEGLKTMGRQRLSLTDVIGLFQDVAANVANRARENQDGELEGMAQSLMAAGDGYGESFAW